MPSCAASGRRPLRAEHVSGGRGTPLLPSPARPRTPGPWPAPRGACRSRLEAGVLGSGPLLTAADLGPATSSAEACRPAQAIMGEETTRQPKRDEGQSGRCSTSLCRGLPPPARPRGSRTGPWEPGPHPPPWAAGVGAEARAGPECGGQEPQALLGQAPRQAPTATSPPAARPRREAHPHACPPSPAPRPRGPGAAPERTGAETNGRKAQEALYWRPLPPLAARRAPGGHPGDRHPCHGRQPSHGARRGRRRRRIRNSRSLRARGPRPPGPRPVAVSPVLARGPRPPAASPPGVRPGLGRRQVKEPRCGPVSGRGASRRGLSSRRRWRGAPRHSGSRPEVLPRGAVPESVRLSQVPRDPQS